MKMNSSSSTSILGPHQIVYLLYEKNPRHKVFLSSIKRLLSLHNQGLIKYYDKQRTIDEQRVQELVTFQTRQIRKDGMPKIRGTIVFCQISKPLILVNTQSNPSPWYIIDGQHRLQSLYQLVRNNAIDDIEVLIEYIEVSNEDEMFKEFQEINSGIPVPLHYLTPNEILNRTCDVLRVRYPHAFSVTKSKRPVIFIDTFKDTIMRSQIIEHNQINTAEDLVYAIEQLNGKYQREGVVKMCDTIGRQNQKERKIIENCFKKCEEFPTKYLFLGIFKDTNWIIDFEF
jgi:hypothetical protein